MKRRSLAHGIWRPLAICLCLCGVPACHRGAPGDAKPDADDARQNAAPISQADKDATDRADALRLTPTDMVKLGVVVTPLEAAVFQPETTGYGQIIGRDAVIQAMSEIEVAQIHAAQSRAALDRSRRLEGTPGADAITEHEAAVRQEAEDRAAIFLAKARVSSLLGQPAARAFAADHGLIEGLSEGRLKLLRATLPLGATQGDALPALRIARLDAAAGDAGWHALHVWPGPVDAAVPGRTFLALLDAPMLAEGERVLAYASAPAAARQDAVQGAVVPASALVLAANDAWVYVEHDPGAFSREHLDTTRPLPAGYFVAGKLAAGTRVITAGAGMLLSRELDVSPDD